MANVLNSVEVVGTIESPFVPCREAFGVSVYRAIVTIPRGKVTTRVYVETSKAAIFKNESLIGRQVLICGTLRSHKFKEEGKERWYTCLFAHTMRPCSEVSPGSKVELSGWICSAPFTYPATGKPTVTSICMAVTTLAGKSYHFQLTSNLFKFMRKMQKIEQGTPVTVRGSLFNLDPEKVQISVEQLNVMQPLDRNVVKRDDYITELNQMADVVEELVPYDGDSSPLDATT